MTAPHTAEERGRVQAAIAMAHLLQRIEATATEVDADQYRLLIAQVSEALQQPLPGNALDAILRTYPAAAELYENLVYDVAGLARSPVDLSVRAEQSARDLLDRLTQSGKARQTGKRADGKA
jgi:predicted ATPase